MLHSASNELNFMKNNQNSWQVFAKFPSIQTFKSHQSKLWPAELTSRQNKFPVWGRSTQGHNTDIQRRYNESGCQWHPPWWSCHRGGTADENCQNHPVSHLPDGPPGNHGNRNRWLAGSNLHYDFVYDILLTHCGLVTPYGDTDLGQHWFR